MEKEKIKNLFNIIKDKFKGKSSFESKNIEEFSFNSTKYSRSIKFKDYLKDVKNLILNQKISSRNQKILSKSQSEEFLSLIKTPQNNNIDLSQMPKTIKNSTSFLLNHKFKNKRSFSAYYINSNLSIRKQYISDLLFKRKKEKKISEIDKKIKLLGKTLNISSKAKKPKAFNKFIKKIKIKKEEKKEINEMDNYSKKKFNIKGTKLLSPFCERYKERHIDEKYNGLLEDDNKFKLDKKSLIDNKLNIFYAENEKIYLDKLKSMNKKRIQQGKKIKYKLYHSPSELQLKDMKNKITFIKKIFDLAYPNTTMMKLRNKIKFNKKNENEKIINKSSDEIINIISNENKKK